MTELELFTGICEYLDIIFPDRGGGPFWGQGTYRKDLFKLFAASYDSCHLHGDQISQYLQDQWFPRRKISEGDRQAVSDICQAWSEWRYAWDNLPQ
jgi:hypothetical protein